MHEAPAALTRGQQARRVHKGGHVRPALVRVRLEAAQRVVAVVDAVCEGVGVGDGVMDRVLEPVAVTEGVCDGVGGMQTALGPPALV